MRIASRSGMRRHACDAHLELARLALAERNPASARLQVTDAAELVQETGYHRRDQEVARLQARLEAS